MAEYRFLTTWVLDAPHDAVFQTIWDSPRWPEWWPGVVSSVELEPGDGDGAGSLHRYQWKSWLPYRITFDMRTVLVQRPERLEGRAHGDLEGTGRWWILAAGDLTIVVYDWQVRTTKRWMNIVAPIARPIFAYNHDFVMRHGGRGLARRLKAELIAHS